jgi:alpha-1,3-glucan synthase
MVRSEMMINRFDSVGGLGQMPGWWYTMYVLNFIDLSFCNPNNGQSESMTTKHLIRQLKQAIHEALGCTSSVRAIMRARSGKQRFPVAQWVEDLDKLHSLAIERHRKFSKYDFRTSWTPKLKNNIPSRRKSSEQAERGLTAHKNHSPRPLLYLRDLKKSSHQGLCRKPILQALRLLGIRPEKSLQKIGLSPQDNQACLRSPTDAQPSHSFSSCVQSSGEAPILPPLLLREGVSLSQSDSPSTIGTNTSVSSGSTTPNPSTGFGSLLNHPVSVRHQHSSDLSLLSVDGIVREKQDFSLQKVNPFFTDSSKVYSTSFEKKLCNLNGKNSEGRLCIEKYLSKSEKDWFSKYRDVRMGRSPLSETSLTSFFRIKVHSTTSTLTSSPTHTGGRKYPDEFALPDDYVPPSGVKRFLLRRIGDWPLYSILLALVSELVSDIFALLKDSGPNNCRKFLPSHFAEWGDW